SGFFLRTIFQRIQIKSQNILIDFFVKSLSCFASEPLIFHHSFDEIRKLEKFVSLIIRTIFVQSVCHVYQSIQTNYINRSESCRFRTTDNRSCQFINFFNGKPHFLNQMEKTHNSENPDAVSDKSRCVFGNYGSFSQKLFSVFIQKIQNFLRGLRTRNNVKQFQITSRIKEVSSTEMFLKIFASAFIHKLNRNSRSVRGNQSARFAVFFDLFVY